jgi:hypothetical protein
LNTERRHKLRPWLLVVALATLIAAPIVLYRRLPLMGVPAALASGVVLIVTVKHLGLAAVLLAPIYALLSRRRH